MLISKTLVSILVTLTLSGTLDNSISPVLRRSNVRNVIKWVLTTWSSRGYLYVLTELKALSHYSRTVALDSTRHPRTGHHLLKPWFGLGATCRGPGERLRFSQIARLARSLPLCPARWLEARKREYIETICPPEGPVTDPKVIRELSLLARAWAKENPPANPFPVGKTSTSACFSHGVRAGGSAFAWAELGLPEVSIDGCIPDTTLDSLCGAETVPGDPNSRKGRTVLVGLISEAEKLNRAIHRVASSDWPYEVRSSLVQERGGKVRPVTCHEVDELVTAHYLRDLFWGPLTRWGPTKDFIAGKKIDAIRRVVKGKRAGRLVYSSDLSSATDMLHQDAADAIVTAILGEWGFGPTIQRAASRVVGVHVVDSSRYQSRGILMGSPLSWSLLNLANCFCYCRALRGPIATLDGATEALELAAAEISLGGDDLIGYSTQSTILQYETKLGDIGFVPNIDKSFVSHTAGVFAECSFRIVGGFREELEPFPPLGGEQKVFDVRVVHAVVELGDVPAKIFSPELHSPNVVLDIGPPATAALLHVPKALQPDVRERMKRCCGIVAPKLVGRLLAVGIDPGAPRGLGGAELPWCKSRLVSTKRLASALASGNVLRLAIERGDASVLMLANLATGWSAAQYVPGGDLAESLALADFPPQTLGVSKAMEGYDNVPVFPVHSGSFDAQVRAASAAHLSALRSWGVVTLPGPRSMAEVGLRKLSDQLLRSRSKLIATYPNAPLTGDIHKSLRKWLDVSSNIVSGPYDPSQIYPRIRGRGHRRRTQYVCAHPDLNHNRHNLYTACKLSLPDFYELAPV